MKQLLVKNGNIIIEDVPRPIVGPNNILVKVLYSCISPGTEIATVKGSGQSLYRRLIKKPEYLVKVYDLIKEKGLIQAKSLLSSKINSAYPIGYSASGVVVSVGENVTNMELGDFVACAGAGYANHADFIDVPVNLVVRLDNNINLAEASTVTLGAIALQGVRRTKPTMGECIVVVGLGILGQLTIQFLKNNGCIVIGVDVDESRVKLGLKNGLNFGINASEQNVVERVLKFTENYGSDAVIITASASNDNIIDQSMHFCRKKGRVVLVGNVSINFSREEFYKKEIDFLISTSYGPGRYDETYEVEGIDYPLPYVRWTENRNMEEYIRQLNQNKIILSDYLSQHFDIEEAPQVYKKMQNGELENLLFILKYDSRNEERVDDAQVYLHNQPFNKNKINIAMIGSGGFARSTHLPNINQLSSTFSIHTIMNRSGATAISVAKQFNSKIATSDFSTVLNDDEVDVIMICTRHDLHASMTLEGLKSNKHVFVEKPLALNEEELKKIELFYGNDFTNKPILMTGFNRRFSDSIKKIKNLIKPSTTPLIINYRMNAGFIPQESWIHGKEGGGRNIGEACHIYDLFNFLTEAKCISIYATSITPKQKQWSKNDNFSVILKYDNGSICNLTYTSMGSNAVEKEKCEIYFDGQIIEMIDFKKVKHFSSNSKNEFSFDGKGHFQELKAFEFTLKNGGKWPISLYDQIAATKMSFEVEKQLLK